MLQTSERRRETAAIIREVQRKAGLAPTEGEQLPDDACDGASWAGNGHSLAVIRRPTGVLWEVEWGDPPVVAVVPLAALKHVFRERGAQAGIPKAELSMEGRNPCDPDCPGWAVFNEDENPELQACDACWHGVEGKPSDDELFRLPECCAAMEAAHALMGWARFDNEDGEPRGFFMLPWATERALEVQRSRGFNMVRMSRQQYDAEVADWQGWCKWVEAEVDQRARLILPDAKGIRWAP